MLKPLRSAICLLVVPAVLASGCGSTTTTSTRDAASTPATASTPAPATTSATKSTPATASTPASKSPPAKKNFPGPASIPGITPKQLQHFKEAKEVQRQLEAGHLTKAAAKAKREGIEKKLEKEAGIGKLGTEAIRRRVSKGRQFPSEVQTAFVTGCTSAKKSIPSCECILAKFEERKVADKSQAIAELLYLEARLRLRESQPRRIQGIIDECRNARA